MTENATQTGLCLMGRSTDSPCPYPASESLPDLFGDDGAPHLCAFHAATQPLSQELDELNLSLELAREYLEAAREFPGAVALIEVLERAEADFTARQAAVGKVLEDLRAAEYRLMRG